MATKPSQQPEIWASAEFYSSGPKIGQPTKATSESGASVEGHKPGPTEPTTANEFNIFENKMSLLCRWTFDGRFDKAADAHPVETDEFGLLSARAADLGDPGQPGPSLSVISSSTDWTANFAVTDHDGIRIQGIYGPAEAHQLFFLTTSMDESSPFPAIKVIGSSTPSCMGMEINTAAEGTIDGEDMKSGFNVYNRGGAGIQVRTQDTVLPALRIINIESGGTSARFGYGNLETGAKKNLDGLAIDCRGGDADSGSGQSRAGDGIFCQGGQNSLSGSKSAGHGIVAFSGPTSSDVPGGSAVFAQTVGNAGIAIEASHNSDSATRPVISVTTGDNPADGIDVSCTESGNGISVQAEGGTGLVITMDPASVSGDIGPAMGLNLQQAPNVDVGAGSLWSQQIVGKLALRMGIVGAAGLDGADRGYVCRTINAPCYARSLVAINTAMASGTDVAVLPDFAFQAGLEPQQASRVRVTIWGQVASFATSATSVQLKVRDKTAVGDPTICTIFIVRGPNAAGSGNFVYSATFADLYVLPTDGARTFDMVADVTAGGGSSSFSGYVEIQETGGS